MFGGARVKGRWIYFEDGTKLPRPPYASQLQIEASLLVNLYLNVVCNPTRYQVPIKELKLWLAERMGRHPRSRVFDRLRWGLIRGWEHPPRQHFCYREGYAEVLSPRQRSKQQQPQHAAR